jgi:hypothetical protein
VQRFTLSKGNSGGYRQVLILWLSLQDIEKSHFPGAEGFVLIGDCRSPDSTKGSGRNMPTQSLVQDIN